MADKRFVRLNHGPDRVYFDDIYHETRCNLELLNPEAQRANTASSHLQKLNGSKYTDVSSGHRCFVIFLNDGPGKTVNITPGRCRCTSSSQDTKGPYAYTERVKDLEGKEKQCS